MTHVMNFSEAATLNADNTLKVFMVEVVTFDDEIHTEYVEACNADEAQDIAAAIVPNADYTMVQSWWVA